MSEIAYKNALIDIAAKLNEHQDGAGNASTEEVNTLLNRISSRVNEAGEEFGAPEVTREIRCA